LPLTKLAGCRLPPGKQLYGRRSSHIQDSHIFFSNLWGSCISRRVVFVPVFDQSMAYFRPRNPRRCAPCTHLLSTSGLTTPTMSSAEEAPCSAAEQ
jgi:hypothetical protein